MSLSCQSIIRGFTTFQLLNALKIASQGGALLSQKMRKIYCWLLKYHHLQTFLHLHLLPITKGINITTLFRDTKFTTQGKSQMNKNLIRKAYILANEKLRLN